MKKSLFTLVAVALCSAAFSATVSVELDSRHSKITTTEHSGLKPVYTMKGAAKDFFFEMRADKEASLEWTEYTISFVPSKSGSYVIGLSTCGDTKSGMNDWIEYDKIELVNAKLNNPSFEFKSVKGDIWAWRYYNKETPKVGKEDAADGKNYLAVTRSFTARQGIIVTAGKKVTIKFMARSGGMTPKVKTPAFFSDQNAPKAK
jgi:hypothetical protein